MKTLRSILVALLFLASAGCLTIQSVVDNSPAAQTPSNVTVLAILTRGGSWTTVGPSNPHEYKILPGGLPSSGFQLWFYAPYPALLAVTIDGVTLPKFEDIPAGESPGLKGFYKIIDINPNPSTPYWKIVVRPPDSQLTSLRYVVGISNVSINPKYRDAAGNNQVSAPLNVIPIAQDVSTMAILFPGAGHGNVSIHAEGDVNSTPMDTFCNAECTIDFGVLYDVTLGAHPSGSSSFGLWSGGCSGSATTCRIHLDGKVKAVGATFNPGSSSGGPAQNCPPLSAPAGYSYFNKPLCKYGTFGDLEGDLKCDANGYYCCGMQTGAHDQKCGIDHRSFPASCSGYDNPKVRLEPSGCYIQN